MKPWPLSTMLLEDRDHVVAFERTGRELTWSDFVGCVNAIRLELSGCEGTHWAVVTPDAFELLCAVCGAWLSGKVPVLVPSTQALESWRHHLEVDGVIGSARVAGLPYVASSHPPASPDRELRIPPQAELVVFTSGSTGQPKQVRKQLRHLQAELDVLESLWGHEIGARAVYATVSPQHMYGLLFRVLWPLTAGRPFGSFALEYPESILSGPRPDSVLVTSPAILKRLDALDAADACRWHTVFSSGGMLPGAAARNAERLLHVRPIEVFGSTETGGVAWRQQTSDTAVAWKVLPEVRVRADAHGFLEVSSPFVGHTGWSRMGDLVEMDTPGGFHVLGRGDRIAKVEDKRVALDEIENALLMSGLVAECAVAPIEHGSRQAIGALVVLTGEGRSLLEAKGRNVVCRDLQQGLRKCLEAVVIPRRIRFVGEIPVDLQGKRKLDAVRGQLTEHE